VWHDGGHLVGKLYRTSESVSANGLSFVYEAAWKRRGFPVSQSLPFHRDLCSKISKSDFALHLTFHRPTNVATTTSGCANP